MEGPPLGPGGEDITWPDQVAPRGQKASSTRKIKPQTSNLILDQWVSMHLDHPHNGQYVQPEKGVYHRRDVGSASALVRRAFSISVL